MSSSTLDIETLLPVLDAVESSPGAADLRVRSYELLAPAPGALVADVGCGAGRAVAELADRGARSVGIDLSEDMIAVSRSRWPDGDFRVGDAYALPFQDGEVAGYRAEKVLHLLSSPERALAEARRVLAPGGRVVLCGQDWDTFVVESSDPELTRRIVHARADRVESPRVARRHRNLLLDAGFRDVTVEVHTGVFTDALITPLLAKIAEECRSAEVITDEQAETWLADQHRRAETDRLFVVIPIFVAAATNLDAGDGPA